MHKISLSVIMPALNEEQNIKDAVMSVLNAFKLHSVDGEIIVVNDGSTDNTSKIVKELSQKFVNVRMLTHDRPEGIGKAFIDGVGLAEKDTVVMFPGDNENNPSDAMIFIGLMEKVDIIIPFIHNIEIRDKTRRLLSAIYRFIINMTFGINPNYTNGTVFYRRSILNGIKVNSSGFFFQAEILIKLIREGYLFAEVPNFLLLRSSGRSKATTLKSLIMVMKDYLRLAFQVHFLGIAGKRGLNELNKDSVTYKKVNNLKDGMMEDSYKMHF